jgi:uncharacterized protein
VEFLSLTVALAILSGVLVGLVLGVIGSGGSILALPLLVYVVGYEGAPHAAIGTSALAVAVSALANARHHHSLGSVRVTTGLAFAIPGVAGALLGARLGLVTPAESILFLFALLLILVAFNMWRNGRAADANATDAPPDRRRMLLRILPAGFAAGILAGFLGIGGGFLIVPALVWAARLDARAAIGTSLVAVAVFGFTTATRYGFAGLLDLPVAGLFIIGGLIGGVIGTKTSHALPRERLRHIFAGVLVIVAAYMLYRNYAAVISAW